MLMNRSMGLTQLDIDRCVRVSEIQHDAESERYRRRKRREAKGVKLLKAPPERLDTPAKIRKRLEEIKASDPRRGRGAVRLITS